MGGHTAPPTAAARVSAPPFAAQAERGSGLVPPGWRAAGEVPCRPPLDQGCVWGGGRRPAPPTPWPPLRGRHRRQSLLSNDSPIHPLTGKSPTLDCDTYGEGRSLGRTQGRGPQRVASRRGCFQKKRSEAKKIHCVGRPNPARVERGRGETRGEAVRASRPGRLTIRTGGV